MTRAGMMAKLMEHMTRPPGLRTKESEAAKDRAIKHARRCMKAPLPTEAEAQALVEAHIAKHGPPKQLPAWMPAHDGNNYAEGFGHRFRSFG